MVEIAVRDIGNRPRLCVDGHDGPPLLSGCACVGSDRTDMFESFFRKKYREIPLVSQGVRNHNICGIRLECGGECWFSGLFLD